MSKRVVGALTVAVRGVAGAEADVEHVVARGVDLAETASAPVHRTR